jgi:hypothetical protein
MEIERSGYEEDYESSAETPTSVRLRVYGPTIGCAAGVLLAIAVLVGGIFWAMWASDSDNRACVKAGGQIVESGIDGGRACVDKDWKLIRK